VGCGLDEITKERGVYRKGNDKKNTHRLNVDAAKRLRVGKRKRQKDQNQRRTFQGFNIFTPLSGIEVGEGVGEGLLSKGGKGGKGKGTRLNCAEQDKKKREVKENFSEGWRLPRARRGGTKERQGCSPRAKVTYWGRGSKVQNDP